MSDPITTQLPESYCTNCGHMVDAATSHDGNETPTSGCTGVCINCAHVMVYGDDMILREPTDQEYKEIAGNPNLIKVVTAVAVLIRMRETEGKG